MTPSLRSHIADVLKQEYDNVWQNDQWLQGLAAALIADPVLRAIIDLAGDSLSERPDAPPEVRALLADWRTR